MGIYDNDSYGPNFDGGKWPWKLERGMGDDFDWWVLRDADDKYVSDACVEGPAEHWRDIALGLRNMTDEYFKRASLHWEGEAFSMCSPRNTLGRRATLTGRDKANELAEIIEKALGQTNE